MDDPSKEMLGNRPVSGELVEWDGEAGWIRPYHEIDHPLAADNEGRLFFMTVDISGELGEVGSAVSFRPYTDGHIVGATDVKPAPKGRGGGGKMGGGKGAAAQNGHGGSPYARKGPEPAPFGGKGQKFGGFGKDMGGKGGGFGKPCGMAGAFGGFGPAPSAGYGFGPPAPAAAPAFSARRMGYGSGMPVYGEYGAPQAYGAGGGYGSAAGYGEQGSNSSTGSKKRGKKERSVEHRVYDALYDGTWTAIEPVLEMEPEWDQKEFTKRLVKYFSKATQSPESLQKMSWPDAVRHIVEHAMHGYSAACGDKQWFFEIDLSPPFGKAAFEIVKDGVDWNRVAQPEVEQQAAAVYEEVMDGILLDKAVWAVAEATFDDEKIASKVFKNVTQAHKVALKEALRAQTADETQRMETFMYKWIEESMGKAWMSIEEHLVDDLVVQMFLGFIVPFGEEHPFSSVPSALTQNVGRPPADWPFVQATVAALFEEWRNPPPEQQSYKKRKKGKAKAEDGEEEYDPEAELGGL